MKSTRPEVLLSIRTGELDIAVKALREIATGKNDKGDKVDFPEDIAREALAALGEEQ